jgi:hypothetical protein
MAGRGRPKKSANQHALEGTFRPDRHGETNEPSAEGEPFQIIALDGHALELWNQIVPRLVKMEIAKAIDSFALCTMCRLAASLNDILDDVEIDEYKRSGAVAAILKQLNVYVEKFGLTPVDRRKGNFAGKKNDNKFAAFLMGLHGEEGGDSAATQPNEANQQRAGRTVHRRSTPRKKSRRKAD